MKKTKDFRQLCKLESCAILYLLHARIEREYHYSSNKSNAINKVDEIMKVSILNPNQNNVDATKVMKIFLNSMLA